AKWWADNIDPGWEASRAAALDLLAASEELQRIVNLVGVEALSSEQRWTLEAASLIKEGLLQQAATDEIDSFASPEKQFALLTALLDIYRQGMKLVKLGAPARRLIQMPLLAQARRWKSQHNSDDLEALKVKIAAIPAAFEPLLLEYAPAAPSSAMEAIRP
ncbi:MAG: V-type ATP synthase subunit A, partial [Proteobacteria bacterium]|nr:V-type ATP synthase subunit A [Pseudomonadota bacterium]